MEEALILALVVAVSMLVGVIVGHVVTCSDHRIANGLIGPDGLFRTRR
jgi:uncharacterized protein YneF (UPF0154 family)